MEITPEIRQAVAEDECRRSGHDVDVVMSMSRTDPVALRCASCGRSWPVGPGTGGYGPEPEPDGPCTVHLIPCLPGRCPGRAVAETGSAADSNAESNAVDG